MLRRHALVIALALAPMVPGHASADTLTFTVELASTVNTEAEGTLEAAFDTETMVFSWVVHYSGLTGPATAAHFHGPATIGENAGILIPIEGDLASPFSGEAILSDELRGFLFGRLLYLNIHTAANPGGELRAQVVQTEEDFMM